MMLFVSVLMHKNVSFHFKNVRLKNQGFYENHCQYLYWLRYVLPKSIIPPSSQCLAPTWFIRYKNVHVHIFSH